MLPLLALSLLVNVFFLGNLFKGEDSFSEELKTGHVTRVIDGDTFDLDDETRIRLAGAQAPEYPEGCLSTKAKERLEELILGQTVQVELVQKDNFGRQVGFVKSKNVFVDKVLIEEGLAQAMNGQHPKYGAGLLSAQDSAQAAKRGLWSSLCAGQKDCLIKGNFRRDRETKVYHLSDCYNYQKIVINEKEDDMWFCTEKEAQAAGFRKSEDCP